MLHRRAHQYRHLTTSYAAHRSLPPVCCRTRRRSSPAPAPRVAAPRTHWCTRPASNSTVRTSPTRRIPQTAAELRRSVLVPRLLSSFAARAGLAGEPSLFSSATPSFLYRVVDQKLRFVFALRRTGRKREFRPAQGPGHRTHRTRNL